MPRSSSASPSEGEIVESCSEKATTSTTIKKGIRIDSDSRKLRGRSKPRSPSSPRTSGSPFGADSTRRYGARRSPSFEFRGSKRHRGIDDFGSHDEDFRRSRPRLDSPGPSKRYRRRTPSPHESPRRIQQASFSAASDRRGHSDSIASSRTKYAQPSLRNLPSPNPELKSTVGKALASKTSDGPQQGMGRESALGASGFSGLDQEELEAASPAVVDDASLIEERRKRREAIKRKHMQQNFPSAKPLVADDDGLSQVGLGINGELQHPNSNQEGSYLSMQTIAQQKSHPEPINLEESDPANRKSASIALASPDEPAAADYDPTSDMREDRLRQEEHAHGGKLVKQDSGIPQEEQDHLPKRSIPAPSQDSTALDNKDFDMFADGDDMFANEPNGREMISNRNLRPIEAQNIAPLDAGMLDDWDDPDGYYKVILGELLDGRYHVQSNLGKGMFSAVIRALDRQSKRVVAIKLIRKNETMRKAGLKEIEILQKLGQLDPEDKKHVIRLERQFDHKGHLCMVFENLSINLRDVLKKFGRDIGINLKAVRAYAQQMFLALGLMRKANILHADIKPDNMLVNESRNVLKICDLGSASDISEGEITPYLVSRFYRAPEIILGIPYDYAIDVWSVGCTLFELYSGKILFTGRSNNQMLRAMMECRGKFSQKMLRKAQFVDLHFDDMSNFRSVETDRITGRDTLRIMNFVKPTRDLKSRLFTNTQSLKENEVTDLNLFLDLLDRCLYLNPEKRCTPAEALKHPFITRSKL